MMLAEAITVLVNGVWREGRRDADTENGHMFMCELAGGTGVSRLAAVTCRFEDEGKTWTRGKLDSPTVNALRTVIALRGDDRGVICSECGGRVVQPWGAPAGGECLDCGARFP